MNILKKICLTDVVGKIPVPIKKVILMSLIGVVTDVKIKETPFGKVSFFIGQFEATDLTENNLRDKNGIKYASSTCYLPDVACELLSAAILKHGTPIDFVYQIGVQPALNLSGLIYTVVSIVDAAPTDSLSHLRNALSVVLNPPEKAAVKKPK